MYLKNTKTQYGLISKLFHWVVVFFIFGLLSIGFFMTTLDFTPQKLQIYTLHKSFGILVLALATARILWRIWTPKPQDLPTHRSWEKYLAHGVHIILYGLLFFIPISGWIMSSAGDFPFSFFGLFEMPDLVSKNEKIFNISRESHEIMAFTILALIALHMAGAFKHHVLDRDETLKRMSFKDLSLTGGLAMAVFFGILWLMPVAINVVSPEDNEVIETTTTINTQENMQNIKGWAIVPAESSINFTATQYGQVFSGKFEKFSGTIIFDADNLAQANVDILIDIASLKTGSSDRDTQAQSKDWFDAQTFPQARFTSNSFRKIKGDQYEANGSLTLRGLSRPIVLPFTLDISPENIAHVQAKINLNRLDFGIGQGEWQKTDAIGNSVEVTIDLKAQKL